jgi:ribosomal protein L24
VVVCCKRLQDLRDVCDRLPLPCKATFLPVEDRAPLLQEPAEKEYCVGQWVRIKAINTKHSHDLGIIGEVCAGMAVIFLIPRLARNPGDAPEGSRKRKRNYKFQPTLFNPELARIAIANNPSLQLLSTESGGITTYTLGACKYRNGLYMCTFPFTAFDIERDPSLNEISWFAKSGYRPLMRQISASMSRASKKSLWLPGDRVQVVEGPLKGYFGSVFALNTDSWTAEVTILTAARDDISPIQSQQMVSLNELQRYFRAGDSVEVAAGPDIGRCGLIVLVTGGIETGSVVFVEDKTRKEVSVLNFGNG